MKQILYLLSAVLLFTGCVYVNRQRDIYLTVTNPTPSARNGEPLTMERLDAPIRPVQGMTVSYRIGAGLFPWNIFKTRSRWIQ